MPLDPQIAAMVAAAPPFPPLREIPIEALRKALRETAARRPQVEADLAQVEDRTIPGPAGELPVRIYTPRGMGPFPIVVYFHGGGFAVGDLDTQDVIPRTMAAGSESVVMSVAYRLAPEHKFPAAPEDAWAAVQWAAANAGSLQGDPTRLAVAGDSAGGVLACGVAIRARDAGGPRLAAQLNWYGPADHPLAESESTREFGEGPMLRLQDVHFFWDLYIADEADYADYRANPARAAHHGGLPPAFIGTAECDLARDGTEAYGELLEAAGVEVEIHRYPGMTHGFMSLVGAVPGARQSMDDACAFLRRQFAKASA
jgi:acetyl esterase